MTYVVSARRSQQLANGAITPLMRGSIDSLPTPLPIGPQLPAALQEDEFCLRMVSAFDEVLAPVFTTLDCIDTYLDAELAPADFVDWLAGWVGIDIDETWTLERRRSLIEQAVALYRIRGTAAGLAAHIKLYSGVTPEIQDSGGCDWSQTADSPMPGTARPHLTVRLRVDDSTSVRRTTVSRIVESSRPAHVPCEVEILVGGTAVPVPEEEVGEKPAADANAPGAVDLPGSEHIELAPQEPPTDEEMDASPDFPPEDGEANT